jgi:hypothetical protein
LGDAANGAAKAWRETGALPDDLSLLRSFLFFEQRRYRHFDGEPKGRSRAYIDALLTAIAELSGGTVPDPPDPLP